MGEKLDLRIDDKDTLHSKVIRVLRKAILKGDFKPGTKLIQSELAESLGVSRMPVREALQKLEAEGLVTIEPHRGATVKVIQMEDINEIYELRAHLEKMALELSFDLLTDEDINELKDLVAEMNTTESVDDFIESNIKFHQILIRRCPWKRLNAFIESLWNSFAQETPQVLSGQVQISNQEHEKILEAVIKKDKYKAATLLSEHIKRTKVKLLESLQNNNEL